MDLRAWFVRPPPTSHFLSFIVGQNQNVFMNENPDKKLCLAVNRKLERVSMSAETNGLIGISVLWRDGNFVGSEYSYFILG